MNQAIQQISPLKGPKYQVVIAGFINLNVIDGSAFFLSGISAMCAQNPFVEVSLIAATPITRTEVIDELSKFANVRIIDPFTASSEKRYGLPSLGSKLSREEYGQIVGKIATVINPAAVLLRDTDAALRDRKSVV